jgi:chromosome segregation ATPase
MTATESLISQLDELRNRRDTLARRITEAQHELNRLNRAINAMEALIDDDIEIKRTADIVREYVDSVEPGTRITSIALIRFAESHHHYWNTDALDRLGAIRCCLPRMAKAGIIIRKGHGEYYTPNDRKRR